MAKIKDLLKELFDKEYLAFYVDEHTGEKWITKGRKFSEWELIMENKGFDK